ncbi:MAG: hypothetical protein IPI58_05740 [Alphaproteobacteria bacterium]|nr:MAG: hypothetical protein IPI58_05740 [Alphaproteobacteria bacterium]
MIEARQIRAARGLLGWDVAVLSGLSGVSRHSLKNIEGGKATPRSDILAALEDTFCRAGIEFLAGPGVRLRDENLMIIEGKDAGQKLLDDVYQTMRDQGGDVLITGVDEDKAGAEIDESFVKDHLERLAQANISERILICEGASQLDSPITKYRHISDQYFNPFGFLIYADKVAMIGWETPDKAIIIQNEALAESYRCLFNFVWDHAETPRPPSEV